MQDLEGGEDLVDCGIYGYVPFEACRFFQDSVNNAGHAARSSTRFEQAASRLYKARGDLGARSQFSKPCIAGLAKIRSDLDPWGIVAGSYDIRIEDGSQSTKTIRDAWGGSALGNAAQFQANQTLPEEWFKFGIIAPGYQMNVQDYFIVNRGVTAYTPIGGNTIYIDAGRLTIGDAGRNQALIMHETIHNAFGIDDCRIMEAIFGPQQCSLPKGSTERRENRPSADFTTWLLDNCVNGPGNY